MALLSLSSSDDLLLLSSDVVKVSGNTSEASYYALVVHEVIRQSLIMRRSDLILTLSSVGIELFDVTLRRRVYDSPQ